MNLSNIHALPEPLVDALERDDYNSGKSDFSVTTLISPPRIAQLKKKYREHLTSDVSDRIFALFGKAVHTILEKSAGNRYLVEHRFFTDHDGARISGQIDIYDKQEQTLSDYKISSYHTVADGAKPEWVAQQNLLRLLLTRNGLTVSKMQNVVIFRDWSKLMAARKPNDYPQSQVKILPIPIWPKEQTEAYLSERISLHREAEKQLPLCTSEERWERPHKWAVMLKGKKRALKLHETKEAAEKQVEQVNQNSKYVAHVEDRPGENTRCLFYCEVAPYCSFYRELVREAAAA